MSYAYLQVQTQIDTILTALYCVQAIILQAVEMLSVNDNNKTLKQNKSWKKQPVNLDTYTLPNTEVSKCARPSRKHSRANLLLVTH
jgi:hypothetical protein